MSPFVSWYRLWVSVSALMAYVHRCMHVGSLDLFLSRPSLPHLTRPCRGVDDVRVILELRIAQMSGCAMADVRAKHMLSDFLGLPPGVAERLSPMRRSQKFILPIITSFKPVLCAPGCNDSHQLQLMGHQLDDLVHRPVRPCAGPQRCGTGCGLAAVCVGRPTDGAIQPDACQYGRTCAG